MKLHQETRNKEMRLSSVESDAVSTSTLSLWFILGGLSHEEWKGEGKPAQWGIQPASLPLKGPHQIWIYVRRGRQPAGEWRKSENYGIGQASNPLAGSRGSIFFNESPVTHSLSSSIIDRGEWRSLSFPSPSLINRLTLCKRRPVITVQELFLSFWG